MTVCISGPDARQSRLAGRFAGIRGYLQDHFVSMVGAEVGLTVQPTAEGGDQDALSVATASGYEWRKNDSTAGKREANHSVAGDYQADTVEIGVLRGRMELRTPNTY